MREIQRKNIDSIKEKYLKEFDLLSLENATLAQGNKFFVVVIDDYKDGKLSPDELSSFGFELFHKVGKKYPDSELFQASLSASELSFALRSKAVYGNLASYFAGVDKFYEANK